MIEKLVRPELKNFIPYNANQIPYTIKLDANESPYDFPETIRRRLAEYFNDDRGLNLYPDTDSVELRKALASYWNADFDGIIAGNGSDQLIQIILHTFVGKGDKVVFPHPSFSMYKLNTLIAGGIPVAVDLKEEDNFNYDIDAFINKVRLEKPKVVFLCSPNNPTGGNVSSGGIRRIAENCRNSIIVIDEAYAEFSRETVIPAVREFENLIVLRTFSKAYGLAGIRCGYSISSKKITYELNKVKPPYNINSLSQLVAKLVFEERNRIEEQIDRIINQRERLSEELERINGIKVYPSKANFIFIKVHESKRVYGELVKRGILIRCFFEAPGFESFFRISVGIEEQNTVLLNELKDVLTQNIL